MLEFAILTIFLTVFALFINQKTGIPSPIPLLTVVLLLKYFGIDILGINNDVFDQLVYLLFPLLVTVDVLHLKYQDIKKNYLSLFYVAVISVVLSVLAGASLNHFILPDYNISTPELIALFCMIMATDPVAVSAVFGNHKLPKQLKIIAEGESLFNDATAMIIFSITMFFMSMGSTPVSAFEVVKLSSLVLFGSILIGFVLGFLGSFLLKMAKGYQLEMAVLLLIGYSAYYLAEHMHWSGIPAIIISIMIGNSVIHGKISSDENSDSGRENNHKLVHQSIETLAIFGSTILFIAIGDLVNIDNLIKYWKEILSVFVASTIIRAVMMKKFRMISNSNSLMQNIDTDWWLILSAAGVKGGLSILMLHMASKHIQNIELFEAIVIGNILLTTFIYPFILIAVIKANREKLDMEISQEKIKKV
jgi:CPA1 family monovalent cation:H+ antiporter